MLNFQHNSNRFQIEGSFTPSPPQNGLLKSPPRLGLKNKIYGFNIKNVYIDKLDFIVNKYNKKYHKTIKIKSADVKSSAYIDSNKEINDKVSKFKVGDIVRVTKYKNIYAKCCIPNWSQEVFVIKKC